MLDGEREIYASMLQDTHAAGPLHRVGEFSIDNWDYFKNKFKEKTYEQAVNEYIDFINTDIYFQTPTWYDSDDNNNISKKLFKKLVLKDLKRYKNIRGKWYSEHIGFISMDYEYIIGVEVDVEECRTGGLIDTVNTQLQQDETDITSSKRGQTNHRFNSISSNDL
jgi:hypothetical protein